MTAHDWISIAAILLSPVIALGLGVWFQDRKARKDRKLWLFRVLMVTRQTPLAPDRVTALNLIDIEFDSTWRPQHKKIRDAWKAYLDHLITAKDKSTAVAAETGENLFANLLQNVASAVGYEFDVTYLKRQIYLPIGHVDKFAEEDQIRRGMAEILRGDRTLEVALAQKRP